MGFYIPQASGRVGSCSQRCQCLGIPEKIVEDPSWYRASFTSCAPLTVIRIAPITGDMSVKSPSRPRWAQRCRWTVYVQANQLSQARARRRVALHHVFIIMTARCERRGRSPPIIRSYNFRGCEGLRIQEFIVRARCSQAVYSLLDPPPRQGLLAQ